MKTLLTIAVLALLMWAARIKTNTVERQAEKDVEEISGLVA